MEPREQRGLAIAALCKLDRKQHLWVVPSQSGTGRYWVDLDRETPRCTCPDFEERGQPCKHIFAVQFTIKRESNPDGSETVTKTLTVAERVTYKQDWPAYNAAQVNEKAKFQRLLADLCWGIPEPVGMPQGGRPAVPLCDRVFASAFKVYSTVSGRRFACDLADAHAKGHISRLPHYNSIFRFLEDPEMTPILAGLIRESSLPLKSVETEFAVDSSGFTTSRFVRWFDQKYGVTRQEHDWVKLHLICGVKTNVVTSVEIGERHSHDSPHFKPLVNATSRAFSIKEVSADAAYLSYDNMELVASHGGTPYIAFKSNSTAASGGMYVKMFHLYNLNRDDYLAHYHKRSNVESTFSMIKAKFGDAVRSKSDTAMVNEALCKVLCHNVCCLIQSMYELGIEARFWGEAERHAKAMNTATVEVDEAVGAMA